MAHYDQLFKLHEEATEDEKAHLALEKETFYQFTALVGDARDARNKLLETSEKAKRARENRRERLSRMLEMENGVVEGHSVHTPAGLQSHTPSSISSKSSATITTASGSANITPKKMDFGTSPSSAMPTPVGAKIPVVDKLPTVHEDTEGQAGIKRSAVSKTTRSKVLVGAHVMDNLLLMECMDDLPLELGHPSGTCIIIPYIRCDLRTTTYTNFFFICDGLFRHLDRRYHNGRRLCCVFGWRASISCYLPQTR